MITVLAIGVLNPVVIVSVDVFAVASFMLTDVGLKTADAPVGKPVALRFTVPVKAAKGVIVIVYCADPVGTRLRVEGVAVIAKSGVED